MPPQPVSPRTAVALGALCVGVGLLIILLAAGILPADERSFHAPHWVVGAAGLMFALMGVALVTGPAPGTPAATGRTTWRSLLLGGAVVGLMAAIFNWIAFGPGERRFGGGLAVPFVAISGRASEWSGRAAFGVAAVLLDLFFLWVAARGLRDLLRRGR